MLSSVDPPPLYACLYHPPADGDGCRGGSALADVAREFSPRYEQPRDDVVSIDVSGLDRLIGAPRTVGDELRREAAARGIHVHVALAATRAAAFVLALARPGVTVVEAGREREALAHLPVAILEKVEGSDALSLEAVRRWGIRTLGELAALPPSDSASRLGRPALAWQAIARGEDVVPLVPAEPEERFEASLELDWPVEGLEPLSFVLTRLLEPLSIRLERRDRGVAILHLELRLVTREAYARHLQLPSPMRDVRTLRTLLLLDLDSHPPPAAIDRVTIVIDPTPGRVVQHTLFTRAQPTPEHLSTLVARLDALLGQARVGAAATVDSYRPGAFRMEPFATEHDRRDTPLAGSAPDVASALRRCRHPIPARAVVEAGRPVRLSTDCRGFPGGAVTIAAGPWRTSGEWWTEGAGRVGEAGGAGQAGRTGAPAAFLPAPSSLPTPAARPWDRDEWDVVVAGVAGGAVYRIFQERATGAWFIDGIVD